MEDHNWSVVEKVYSRQITFYLHDYFESNENLLHVLEYINAASQNDLLYFHLNSGGGELSAFNSIRAALINNQSKIASEVIYAASAAAFLALLSDELVVYEFSKMMLHAAITGSSRTTGSNLKAHADSTVQSSEQLLNGIVGFITHREREDLLNGKELWLHGFDIAKRFTRFKRYQRMLNNKKGQEDE